MSNAENYPPSDSVLRENRETVRALQRLNRAAEKLTAIDINTLAGQAEAWLRQLGKG